MACMPNTLTHGEPPAVQACGRLGTLGINRNRYGGACPRLDTEGQTAGAMAFGLVRIMWRLITICVPLGVPISRRGGSTRRSITPERPERSRANSVLKVKSQVLSLTADIAAGAVSSPPKTTIARRWR